MTGLSGESSNTGDSCQPWDHKVPFVFSKNHLSIQKAMIAMSAMTFSADPKRNYDTWVSVLLRAVSEAYGKYLSPADVVREGHFDPIPDSDTRYAGLKNGELGTLLRNFQQTLDGWCAPSVDAARGGSQPPLTHAQANTLRCLIQMLIKHTLSNQQDAARNLLRTLKFDPNWGPRVLWHDLMLFHCVVDQSCPSPHFLLHQVARLLPDQVGAAVIERQDEILLDSGPHLDNLELIVRARRAAMEHLQSQGDSSRAIRGITAAATNLVDNNVAHQLSEVNRELRTMQAMVAQVSTGPVALGALPSSMSAQELFARAKAVAQTGVCGNCGASGHRSNACPAPASPLLPTLLTMLKGLSSNRQSTRSNRRSASRQYSSVVFAHASVAGVSDQVVRWLVDTGAEVTAINSTHPLARKIKWGPPQLKLTTADGQDMAVVGEARVTLRFRGGGGKRIVERRVTLQCVEGLSADGILGADLLFSRGRCSIFLHEGTGHGSMRLGPGEEIALETPEDATMSISAVRAGLTQSSLKRKSQKVKRPLPKVLLKISRTPILTTIEEVPEETGERKPKLGDAKVVVSDELTCEERAAIDKMLKEQRDAFANTEDEVGIAEGFQFNIDLLDRNPVTSGKNRRIPYHLRDQVTAILQDMERQGIIKKSFSPYCSGLVIVKKADGSLRLCVDYKELNAKTADDGFQLPLVEEQMLQLQGSKYFTGLDLFRGYHQLRVAPASRALTAFNGNGVHYEYCVLPFGPKNGPAAFARFVFHILGDLQARKKPVVIFFDDIIIGGATFQEHVELVREVLDRLRQASVVVKSSKARFAMSEITCLGYIVDREGIRPDPEKVEAIKSFPRPVDQTELRGFLGLLNFYGTLVPKLQEIVHPLNRALSKAETQPNKQLEWSPTMISSFDRAKALFSDQVLAYLPDFSKPFIVTSDASESGLAACLSQRDDKGNEMPIAFYSKGLNPKSLDPDAAAIKTRELELYAFLLATRKWRHYLYGRRFEWRTDHKPLMWDEKNPNRKVEAWLAELKELDFETTYLKGETNVAADTLSRYGFTRATGMIAALSRSSKVFVPSEGREEVLRRYHDQQGHRGVRATATEIATHFYWPGLRRDVAKWCESCDICQKTRGRQTTELQDEVTTTATKPFEVVMMDLYFRRYRVPELVRSDNGLEFTTLGSASIELGFEWSRNSPHNPPSSGPVERVNQTLINEIMKLRAEGRELQDAVELGCSLYNNRVHSATGYSPYRLVFGTDRPDPDLVVEQPAPHRVNLDSQRAKWARARAQADREAFTAAAERDAAVKLKRLPTAPVDRFKVGDLVLTPRINRTKTDPRWAGPYEIIQVRAGGTYRARHYANFRDRILRHHRYLKPYVLREGQPTIADRKPPTQKRAREGAGGQETGTYQPTVLAGGVPEDPVVPMDDIDFASAVDPSERHSADLGDTEMEVAVPVMTGDELSPIDLKPTYSERKDLARDRRPEPEEEPAAVLRRSERSTRGVPPRKYLIDKIESTAARVARLVAMIQHWTRSTDVVKQLALLKLTEAIGTHVPGGEECGDTIYSLA